MVDNDETKQSIQELRDNPDKLFAGVHLDNPGIVRTLANQLIIQLDITDAWAARPEIIDPEMQLLFHKWKDLTPAARERVLALVRHKLSLQYDPTMVDPEWRD